MSGMWSGRVSLDLLEGKGNWLGKNAPLPSLDPHPDARGAGVAAATAAGAAASGQDETPKCHDYKQRELDNDYQGFCPPRQRGGSSAVTSTTTNVGWGG